MAVDLIRLPKNKYKLARIIDLHAEREEARLVYRRTMWLLAWYYLNGARRFDVFDPTVGLIEPYWLDSEGNLEFQSQELLSAVDRISGRLRSLDIRPKVERTGSSLGAIRDRAVGDVILNSLTGDDHLRDVKTQFAHIFTLLGSCGIASHLVDSPTVGLVGDLEVVHPQEMFPFPSLGQDYTKKRGMIRQRTVTLAYLEEKYGRKIRNNLELMEWWEIQAGEVLADVNEYDIRRAGAGAYAFTSNTAGTHDITESETTIGVVKLRELWLDGPRGTCSRYIVTSGDYVIDDQRFDDVEMYCPIGWARFIESSTFHGLGAFDLLFSICRELERLLKSLFNNVRDLDRYGITVLPQGQFNDRAQLREVGKGLRVLNVEPDPMLDNFRPFTINPHNLGDVPGKVAGLAKDMMDGLNPVRDLIEEKGRIDSAPALGFLDEQVNRAMTNPSSGVEVAYGQAYRHLLQSAGRKLALSPRPIPVNILTLDLAGAVIDAESSTVNFPENPLPSISRLSFTVKERSPRSEVTRKQEAIQMMEAAGGAFADPQAFKIFALEEGLDFAMWMGEDQAAYESIVRNILILYGDGQDSGEIVVTPHTSKPDLQLRILGAFMTSPIMAMASPEVQDEFMFFQQFLVESSGMVLPAAIQNPDDYAMMMVGPEQLAQQMGQQGGGQQQQQPQEAMA